MDSEKHKINSSLLIVKLLVLNKRKEKKKQRAVQIIQLSGEQISNMQQK